jgi:hypothetical protein
MLDILGCIPRIDYNLGMSHDHVNVKRRMVRGDHDDIVSLKVGRR